MPDLTADHEAGLRLSDEASGVAGLRGQGPRFHRVYKASSARERSFRV